MKAETSTKSQWVARAPASFGLARQRADLCSRTPAHRWTSNDRADVFSLLDLPRIFYGSSPLVYVLSSLCLSQFKCKHQEITARLFGICGPCFVRFELFIW